MKTIAFYLGESGYWGDVTVAPMLGGRERAAVRVAEELANRDWDVAIYAAVPRPVCQSAHVWYYPLDHFAVAEAVDVVVAVEGYDCLRGASGVRVAWMQTGVYDFRSLRGHVDRYVVNSPTKHMYLIDANPFIPDDRVWTLPNGCDPDDYAGTTMPVPGRFLWNQSPDRGLHHLLRWWPTLRAEYPHLTLHVTYDLAKMDGYRWTMDLQAEWARVVDQGRYLPGVTYLGAVSRQRLIEEQKECFLYVYPCDPANQGETYNIAAMELACAQVPMLLSDDIALAEPYGQVAWFAPLPIDNTTWLTGIRTLLDDRAKRTQYVDAAYLLARSRSWAAIAAQWDALLRPVCAAVAA